MSPAGETIDLPGVRTWYAEYGDGDPLVYLHGGMSDARELDPVLDTYAARFRVYAPERRGHGHTPDVDGPITFPAMTADTVAFLESVVGAPADLVGFSDGATTALHVALDRPDLVRRLVLISGQFHHTGLLPVLFGEDPAATAAAMADSQAQSYAEVSPDGAAHFPVFAEKIVRLALTEPVLEAAQLELVARLVLDFLTLDPVPTFVPVRRAH
jgi:pimeloyl-ACP methyl ester carboxylesterase